MNSKRAIKVSEFIAHGSNVTACTIGHKSSRIAATGGEDAAECAAADFFREFAPLP